MCVQRRCFLVLKIWTPFQGLKPLFSCFFAAYLVRKVRCRCVWGSAGHGPSSTCSVMRGSSAVLLTLPAAGDAPCTSWGCRSSCVIPAHVSCLGQLWILQCNSLFHGIQCCCLDAEVILIYYTTKLYVALKCYVRSLPRGPSRLFFLILPQNITTCVWSVVLQMGLETRVWKATATKTSELRNISLALFWDLALQRSGKKQEPRSALGYPAGAGSYFKLSSNQRVWTQQQYQHK